MNNTPQVDGIHFCTDLNDEQVLGLCAYYAQSLASIVSHFDEKEVPVIEFSGHDAFRVEEAAKFLSEMADGKVVF